MTNRRPITSTTTLLVIAFLATASTLVEAANQATKPIVFYVSPKGDDSWSGTLAQANADRTDGPFASLEAARDAIRRLKTEGRLDRPVAVLIRGGVYRLSAPFVLEPRDSGTPDCPITYTAYEGEKVVFSGGRTIKGWRKGDGEVWTAQIEDVRSGGWYFRSLFVNGERRRRARTPNEGYLRVAGKAPARIDPETSKPISRDRTAFRFKPGDLRKWYGLEDANIITFHSWTTSRFFIQSLDTEENVVELAGRSRYEFLRWDKKQRYVVENVPEALDAPGEWYLDRKTGILSYIPLEGQDPRKAEIIAPVLSNLVRFHGDPDNGKFVEYVTFSNLSFLYTDWTIGREGHSFPQAAIDGSRGGVEPAMLIDGARYCTLEALEVAHVGGYGIALRRGCFANRIERCHVHDLGAGGILIGETRLPEQENARTYYNVVSNCFIHDGGNVYPSGVGVWIGKSSYNSIVHNEICDFYYTGVSVGWSWGYKPSSAHHNLVAYNHIHHIGFGVLSDMGGIYTLGRSPGTHLHHNLIHHVESYSYGGWGIYPDEGSSDIIIENNIVYRTKTGGFHQHYGRDNIVRNNIFAFSRDGQIIRTRNEKHRSFVFERNIVFFDRGKLLGSNWKGNVGNFLLDYNLYWDASGREVTFAGKSFSQWRAAGQDVHSIIADPLFLDPYNYDFRLKPQSPAFRLGFEPIDMRAVGLQGPREWTDLPEKVKRRPWPVPDPRP